MNYRPYPRVGMDGGGWGFDIHSPNILFLQIYDYNIKFPRGGAQFQHQMQSMGGGGG